MPELLSPAGSPDALDAAIAGGADSVYLSGKDFSARKRAQNFTPKDLSEGMRKARKWGVKVYVAVNTLITNDQLEPTLRYIGDVYSEGADALIVQDMAVARVAHDAYPDLDLHASTQTSADSPAAVEQLREFGFSRVIANREATFEELTKMCKVKGVSVEAFVHGALCISYSGQCLFSSIAGGRSGNRGLCAQPCRNKYAPMVNERRGPSRFWLSPKDLQLAPVLEDLVGTGVGALKIEGRLKTPHYVLAVTHVYRELLDAIEAGEHPKLTKEHERMLKAVYNRDSCHGYKDGWPGRSMITPDHSAPLGEPMGKVKWVQGRRLLLVGAKGLKEGDGLAIGDDPNTRTGLVVHGLELVKEGTWMDAPRGLEVDKWAPVFRTLDAEMAKKFSRSLDEPIQKIPIDMVFTAGTEVQPSIVVTDGTLKAKASLPDVPEAAQNQALSPDSVRDQLDRLKGTPYYLRNLDVELEDDVFMPLSQMNQLRREAVDRLDRLRSAPPKRKIKAGGIRQRNTNTLKAIAKETYTQAAKAKRKKQKLIVRVSELESAWDAAIAGADIVILPAYGGDVAELKTLDGKLKDKGVELALSLPHMSGQVATFDALEVAKGVKPSIIELTCHGHLIPAMKAKVNWQLMIAHSFNITNSLSLARYASLKNLTWVQPSIELTLEHLRGLAFGPNIQGMVLAEGVIPQMTTRHCLFRGVAKEEFPDPVEEFLPDGKRKGCPAPCDDGLALADRMKFEHAVVRDGPCRNVVLNSNRISLYNRSRDVFNGSSFSPLLDLRWVYGPDEVNTIVGAWAQLAEHDFKKVRRDSAGIEQAHKAPLTHGHLYRGVE